MTDLPAPKENPWITRNEKTLYENPWIRLTEYDVLNPSGHPNAYGVVHFKNIAVGICPVEDGHIWLVGQTRYPLGQYSWELPEGGCPQGEDPVETAHRELQEEAGLKAAEMTPILTMHLSNSVSDERAEIFIARGLSPCAQDLEDTEDITVRKVTLETFFRAVERGEITDSLTVAAAYKLMVMQQRGEI